jgi:hypothetical protein
MRPCLEAVKADVAIEDVEAVASEDQHRLRNTLQVDAIIRQTLNGWRPCRVYNDTTMGRPTTGRPIGSPVVDHPQGVFGVFSYYRREAMA